jgi:DDE family transposase
MTSDGGLILVRELDERLGLEKLIEEHLSDSRQGLNKPFTLSDLLQRSVYSRLAGYEDLNDAERLAADPTFRLISSQRVWDRIAALPSQ